MTAGKFRSFTEKEARVADWAALFDEAYPAAGASQAEVEQFAALLGEPLSAVEADAINRSQRNPFAGNDPLYAAYQPFDPSRRTLPDRPLPPSYRAFLRWSNGGEFRTGERWFQFFPAQDSRHGVRAMLLAYHLPGYGRGGRTAVPPASRRPIRLTSATSGARDRV
jgi:hypothetical protein